ncbi:hypothetical protein EDD17DRAFT_1556035 [Pisolithus thermaeus]|nr:hypothetical protein EDD17DRAFT_1556035 [Pisolithus thermaeus]
MVVSPKFWYPTVNEGILNARVYDSTNTTDNLLLSRSKAGQCHICPSLVVGSRLLRGLTSIFGPLLVDRAAFMHAQLAAQINLKPENIVIPTQGGFTPVRLKSDKQKFRGIVGTAGYIAPEVECDNSYKPIQADLWSCGRTLQRVQERIVSRERALSAGTHGLKNT